MGALGSALEEKAAFDDEKIQKKVSKTQKKIRDILASRERRKVVREARVVRAEAQAGAQASGTTGTSSAVTGIGGIGSQLLSNLSFLDQVGKLNDDVSIFQQRLVRHREKTQRDMRRSGTGAAITNLAVTGASLYATGGFSGAAPAAGAV